jgi:hypothetical protein
MPHNSAVFLILTSIHTPSELAFSLGGQTGKKNLKREKQATRACIVAAAGRSPLGSPATDIMQ